MEIKKKKRLIVGLTVGIPAAAGLATALGVCVRCSTEEFITIPSDKLNISGDTLKGLKENADVSKYTTLEIPSEVRNIEKSAFKDVFKAGSTVTTVKFNKNVRKLGDSVFENCAGITTFDLTDVDEEAAKYIDWGNNIFGTDETTKPVYINIKFNETLSDTAKEQLKNKMITAGIPAASFAPKVTDKVEVKSEEKSKEVSDIAKVEMTLTMTEEEKLTYVFKASAERDGGTPGVGVKLGDVKVEEITNDTKKYKATVDAEMVNAKNNGDYVTYKIDMIAMSGEQVKWVQTLENFKLVYNKDTPPAIVHVTGVSLDQPKLNLEVGEETTLVETVTPANASDKTVTWDSSNKAVATVENGVVKAITEGSAIITVKTNDGGFEATSQITVEQASTKVDYSYTGYKEDGTETTVESEIAYYAESPKAGETYEGKISFASSHNDKPVKTIRGFENQTDITWIRVPASVETIEANCFAGCTGLVKATVANYQWTLRKEDTKQKSETLSDDLEANADVLVTSSTEGWSWYKGEVAPVMLTITFVAGQHGHLEGSTSATIEYGSKWSELGSSIPTPVADSSYKFKEWKNQNDVTITDDTILNKDITATANFESQGLEVLFNVGTGKYSKSLDPDIMNYRSHSIKIKYKGADVTSKGGWKYTCEPAGMISIESDGRIKNGNSDGGKFTVTITYNSETATIDFVKGSYDYVTVEKNAEDSKWYLSKSNSMQNMNKLLMPGYIYDGDELVPLYLKKGSFQDAYLHGIWFGDGIKEIPEDCFNYAYLNSTQSSVQVTIPSNIEKIGARAFKTCQDVGGVTVETKEGYQWVLTGTSTVVTFDTDPIKNINKFTNQYQDVCKNGIEQVPIQ